jgi:hypothetical protein
MMLSKKATLVPFAVLLGLPTPLLADKLDSSADSFLPRCRAIVNHEFNKNFDLGLCAGAMIALHDATIVLHLPSEHPLRSCMPESITVEQSVAVVVSWLDHHPESRRENFIRIAMSALHEAWPCDE